MKRAKKWVMWAVFLMGTQGVSPAFALDLKDVYELALEHDAQTAMVDAAYQSGKETLVQSRALFYPAVSASMSAAKTWLDGTARPYNPVTNQYLSVSVDNTVNAFNYGITIVQPLFHYDHWQLIKSAKVLDQKNELEYQWAQQHVMLRVAEAYFAVLRAEDRIVLARNEARAVEEQKQEVEKNYRSGLASATDLAEAEAALDSARVNLIVTEGERDQMLESLYVLTGQKIDRVDRVSDFPLPQSLSTYTQWAVQAEKENPGLIAAGLLLESLQHEANRHRGYWYPKVDLAANYFNNDVNNEAVALLESAQDYTSSSVGITVSMPIDVSGVNRSRHRQAALKVQETEHLLELQTREIAKEARNLVRKLEIDERRVAAREQSVISSEKAYTATRSGYRVGSRTLPEVLLAQRNVFANRLDLANARYDRLLGEFRLKFLAGALSRQDIETLNQCLE